MSVARFATLLGAVLFLGLVTHFLNVKTLRPFKSFRDFLVWLLIGGYLYGIACLDAWDLPDVPWIERGIYPSLLSFAAAAWMLFPLIQLIRERIDTQPRG